MSSGNSSAWISAGQEHGIDLGFLYQDKTKIHEMLAALELPHPSVYRFHLPNFRNARALFDAGTHYFARLVPHSSSDRRPYRLRLATFQDLVAFTEENSGKEFDELHLVEKGREITHTGSIIALDDAPNILGKCIIELIQGDGPNLFHGHRTPISCSISQQRALRFHGTQEPTNLERAIIFQAVHYVGGRQHPFPGYYEFETWAPHNQIMFRNYQGPETAYAQL